jgi:hypothetical protein
MRGRRRALVAATFAAIAIAVAAACTLNPQPLPPGDEEPPRAPSGSGGGETADPNGGFDKSDAAASDAADAGDG